MQPSSGRDSRSGFVVLVALQRRLSRGRQNQQQQAVALRIQQPGLSAERFLPRRIF
jgi:hypothetical protein